MNKQVKNIILYLKLIWIRVKLWIFPTFEDYYYSKLGLVLFQSVVLLKEK